MRLEQNMNNNFSTTNYITRLSSQIVIKSV